MDNFCRGQVKFDRVVRLFLVKSNKGDMSERIYLTVEIRFYLIRNLFIFFEKVNIM